MHKKHAIFSCTAFKSLNGRGGNPVRLLAIAAFLIALLFVAGKGRADIYRYVDEDGVECFTDAPTKKGAVRIIKEQKVTRQKSPNNSYAHPPCTAGVKNGGPERGVANVSRALADFILPVRGVISSPVGLRHDPIDGMLRHHNGIDIAVPEGTPVKPAAPGVVTFSGCRSGYGNMVIVAHDDGTVTVYAHNSANLVREGEVVAAGSTIALSGSTGRSTGPHLHFEMWKDGVNITMTFLSGVSGKGTGVAGLYPQQEIIRRIVQADGTLLFTNLR